MKTPVPQEFAEEAAGSLEETGAVEEALAFEGSVGLVDPRFVARRPVAFLDALLDARV